MPVKAYTVKTEDLPVELEYPARIRSFQRIEVRAKVQGTLMKQYYTEGQLVKKGTPLFLIEPLKYEAAVNMAQAQVNMAKAQLQQTKRDWERVSKLYSDKVVSDKERDSALSAYENAQAGLASAEAALANAKIDLGYTKVEAPFDGYAGMRSMDVGGLVNINTVLTTLTQTDPVFAEFSIPDMDSLRQQHSLEEGSWTEPKGALKARLLLSNEQSYALEGQIDFIDSVISENTGTIQARAVFANPKNELIPGQFARIVLSGIIRNNAVKIPQEAVMQTAGGSLVMTIKEGKVAPQPVVLGDTDGKMFVVMKGLNAGDEVITNNLTKLRPGAPVQKLPGE